MAHGFPPCPPTNKGRSGGCVFMAYLLSELGAVPKGFLSAQDGGVRRWASRELRQSPRFPESLPISCMRWPFSCCLESLSRRPGPKSGGIWNAWGSAAGLGGTSPVPDLLLWASRASVKDQFGVYQFIPLLFSVLSSRFSYCSILATNRGKPTPSSCR